MARRSPKQRRGNPFTGARSGSSVSPFQGSTYLVTFLPRSRSFLGRPLRPARRWLAVLQSGLLDFRRKHPRQGAVAGVLLWRRRPVPPGSCGDHPQGVSGVCDGERGGGGVGQHPDRRRPTTWRRSRPRRYRAKAGFLTTRVTTGHTGHRRNRTHSDRRNETRG